KTSVYGRWMIYRIENVINGEYVSIPVGDKSPFIEFKSNGQFEGHNDLGIQEGTWSFEDINGKKQIILNQSNDTVTMYLEELNRKHLVWRIEEDESKLKFYCNKAL